MTQALAAVGTVVEEAGALLLALRANDSVHELAAKPDGPVSTADLEVQALMSERLRELVPGSVVIGEEDTEPWGPVLSRHAADTVWIIDPLDGTSAYLAGADTFGVQVAAVRSGAVVGGWIVCPALGWSASGWDGCDALSVRGVRADDAAEASDDLPSMVIADGDFTDTELRAVTDLKCRVKYRGTRSCSVDYLELAGGQVDLVLYRRTLPWDHAPGAYIISRLGGLARQWSGGAYDVAVGDSGMVAVLDPEHLQVHGSVVRALGDARTAASSVLERGFNGRG